MKISVLFEKEPSQWGLRGDPYLWQEMRLLCAETDMPACPQDLQKFLHDAFFQLTGRPLKTGKVFTIERLKHGGMSSGGISPKFWEEKAIPLLLSRFPKLD